mmetsp:Transcript_104574/g.181643  ORF Transcript_104574/g.181643 Transcript_104574/m.181643 type:complete len:320 (+) Transcript_104574:83-1042(+)
MAPKKKPSAGKEGEVDLFEEFLKKYAKNQKEYDTPKIQEVQDIIAKQEEEEVGSWNFAREFDPMAFRVLFHSLRQTGLNTIKAIRIWKCNGGDESVRSVCYYLDSVPSPAVEDLAFTDNGVTALGCEFLGRTLGPSGNKIVNKLVLDFNKFGTAGVEMLSLGLSQNSTLRHLSMRYCDIGEDGGQYIAHILMFIRNSLTDLELRGNYLRNRGIIDVFTGARRTKNLTRIDVFDNKFSDSPEVIDALKDLFANNTKLVKYDLSGNQISDEGAGKLVAGMIGQPHLAQGEVLVPERCSMKTWEAIEELQTKGKKKGKKKKK